MRIWVFLILIVFTCHPSRSDELVVSTGEWPPIITQSIYGYGSIAINFKTELAKEGYDLSFEFMPWARAYEQAKNGNAALTGPWVRNEERDRDLIFAGDPVVSLSVVGYLPRPQMATRETLRSYEEIIKSNLRVVGVRGYWYEKIFRQLKGDVHYVSSAETAWKMISAGRADIYVDADLVGNYEADEYLGNGAIRLFSRTPALEQLDLFFAISRKHPKAEELKELLTKRISNTD